MNRSVATLALAAALSLVGCMKTTDVVTVKADGSGAYSETMQIDMAAMKELAGSLEGMRGMMPPGFGGGPGSGPGGAKPPAAPPAPGDPGAPTEPPKAGDPTAPSKPPIDPVERLKSRWKDIPGLEVTKTEVKEVDGKQNVQVEATFQSLEAYAQATSFDMNADLVKNEDGSYTLKFEGRFGPGRGPGRGRRGEPGMGEGEPGMDGAGMEGPPEGTPPGMDGGAPGGMPPGDPMAGMFAGMLAMIEKPLAGLEFTRTLKLPGSIVETNGTKGEDGASVTWKVTYEDIKNGVSGKSAAQSVTFKGDGLDLKPFSIKRNARRSFMGGMGGPPRGPGGPPPMPPPTPGMDEGPK